MNKKIIFTFLALFYLGLGIVKADGSFTPEQEDSIDNLMAVCPILNLSSLDSVLDKYNVYMTGENHGYPENNRSIEFQFLKYLHQKKKANHLILEFGYTTGWLINQYVYYNDTTLAKIFSEMPNRHYKKYFDEIRKYNLSQKQEDKIKVHGIDAQKIESMIFLAFDYLIKQKDIRSAKDSIQMSLEVIKIEAGKVKDEFVDEEEEWKNTEGDFDFASRHFLTLTELQKNIQNHKAAYLDFFKEDKEQFLRIAANIQELLDYSRFRDYSKAYYTVMRERIMISRLQEIKQKENVWGFFGQFGKCHTSQLYASESCSWKNFTPIADRIKQTPNFKALTIGISYDYWDEKTTHNESYYDFYMQASKDSAKIFKYQTQDSILSQPDYLLITPVEELKSLQKEIKKDKEEVVEEVEVSSERSKFKNRLHLDGNYYQGQKLFKSNSFDFVYTAGENFKFSDEVFTQGGGINVFEDGTLYIHLDYLAYKKSSLGLFADSLTANFSGYQLSYVMGGDLTKTSLFNVIPYGGVSFARTKINIIDNSLSQDLFYTGKEKYVSNNAFLFDVGADVNFNFKFINFGARGGYQLDVSDKNWKHANENYSTTFTGWYFQLYAGFTILTYAD